MYPLNPLFEMTYDWYKRAFENRDKSRDAARGLDKAALFKKFKGDGENGFKNSFSHFARRGDRKKISANSNEFIDNMRKMYDSVYSMAGMNPTMDKPLSKSADRQNWIKSRKAKIRNKKLALGAVGLTGAAALGYGGYKYIKKKKDKKKKDQE